MGAGGGPTLVALAILALWGADPVKLHLEPAQGSALVSGRLDTILRDSLRALNADLFPLDSMARLVEKGDWPSGERSTAAVRLRALTKRPALGWVKVDLPASTFHRIPWFPLYGYRRWILEGEIFRSSAPGTMDVERFSLPFDQSLGFVATHGAEKFPASSSDRALALDTLGRLAASKAARFLVSTDSAKGP